jgi:hypothetical protein
VILVSYYGIPDDWLGGCIKKVSEALKGKFLPLLNIE